MDHKATICLELSVKYVRAGGRPLPLHHYSPTPKKFGSGTRKATLPVQEVKSGGKHSRIIASETSFSCFAVLSSKSTCKSAVPTRTEREIGKIYNNGQ